jgi:hypothetical protein
MPASSVGGWPLASSVAVAVEGARLPPKIVASESGAESSVAGGVDQGKGRRLRQSIETPSAEKDRQPHD